MNKIQVKNNVSEWNIGINRIKLILDFNPTITYAMVKTIEHCFAKSSPSEFQEEHKITHLVTFNEQRIDKSFRFIKINLWDSFSDNIKLLSKSLLTEYLEFCLTSIELEESFLMLKEYFNQFSKEILDSISIDYELTKVNFRIPDFGTKLLMKLISAELLEDEVPAEDIDLSFEAKTMIFLCMIEGIASRSLDKTFIVLIDHFLANSDILDRVRMSSENVHYLLLANSKTGKLAQEEVFISARQCIDLGVEEELFQTCVVEYGLESDMQSLNQRFGALFANSKTPVIDLANMFYPII
jgi:hypothetical protein